MEVNRISTGLDQISSLHDTLRYEKVALLTTGSALNRWMIPALQCVNDHFKLSCLFAAEYGIMGEKRAGERFESYTDIWTGHQVFSLYRYGSDNLAREMLAQFDYLLVDLPITGTRYASNISTMHALMRQLGNTGKKIIILDRPNPLGGETLDGTVLVSSLRKNEDDFPLPARHALTLGELCQMMNAEDNLGADLDVLSVKNWSRAETHDKTKMHWIISEQHLPRLEACVLSVGLEVLQGCNLSIGLGSSLPFQVVAAPYLDAIQLAAAMNKKNLTGLLFSPIYFTPSSDIYQGCKCQGIQIHVTDIAKVKPVRMIMELINEILRLAGKDFTFLQDKQGKYIIDYLFGNNRLRRQPQDIQVILEDSAKDLEQFKERSLQYRLYE